MRTPLKGLNFSDSEFEIFSVSLELLKGSTFNAGQAITIAKSLGILID